MANGGTTEELKQNTTLNILLLLHKRNKYFRTNGEAGGDEWSNHGKSGVKI